MSDTIDTGDLAENTSSSGTAPASDPMFKARDPIALFSQWLDEAAKTEPNDPNTAALATVDADGLPNVRMILLKGVDSGGKAPRGLSLSPIPGRRCVSTGSPCAVRCG